MIVDFDRFSNLFLSGTMQSSLLIQRSTRTEVNGAEFCDPILRLFFTLENELNKNTRKYRSCWLGSIWKLVSLRDYGLKSAHWAHNQMPSMTGRVLLYKSSLLASFWKKMRSKTRKITESFDFIDVQTCFSQWQSLNFANLVLNHEPNNSRNIVVLQFGEFHICFEKNE